MHGPRIIANRRPQSCGLMIRRRLSIFLWKQPGITSSGFGLSLTAPLYPPFRFVFLVSCSLSSRSERMASSNCHFCSRHPSSPWTLAVCGSIRLKWVPELWSHTHISAQTVSRARSLKIYKTLTVLWMCPWLAGMIGIIFVSYGWTFIRVHDTYTQRACCNFFTFEVYRAYIFNLVRPLRWKLLLYSLYGLTHYTTCHMALTNMTCIFTGLNNE